MREVAKGGKRLKGGGVSWLTLANTGAKGIWPEKVGL